MELSRKESEALWPTWTGTLSTSSSPDSNPTWSSWWPPNVATSSEFFIIYMCQTLYKDSLKYVNVLYRKRCFYYSFSFWFYLRHIVFGVQPAIWIKSKNQLAFKAWRLIENFTFHLDPRKPGVLTVWPNITRFVF